MNMFKSSLWYDYTDHSKNPMPITQLIALFLLALTLMVAPAVYSQYPWIVVRAAYAVAAGVLLYVIYRIIRAFLSWRICKKSQKEEIIVSVMTQTHNV